MNNSLFIPKNNPSIVINSVIISGFSIEEAMNKITEILNTKLENIDISSLSSNDQVVFTTNYLNKNFAISVPSLKWNINNKEVCDLVSQEINLETTTWTKHTDTLDEIIFILSKNSEPITLEGLDEKYLELTNYLKQTITNKELRDNRRVIEDTSKQLYYSTKVVFKTKITKNFKSMEAVITEIPVPEPLGTIFKDGVESLCSFKTSGVHENQIYQTRGEESEPEFEYRTISVLAKVKRMANNKSHLQFFSSLLGTDIRNCTVDTDKLDKLSIVFNDNSLIEKVNIENYHQMLMHTEQQLPYKQAQHVLWFCKFGMARKHWIDNNKHFIIYSAFSEDMSDKDILDPNAKMELYWGSRHDESTITMGWSPTLEDKAATDWIIVR